MANVRSIIARSNASGAGADRRIRCWRRGRAQTTADTESLASFTGKVPSNKPRKNYEPKFTGQFKGQGGGGGSGTGSPPSWLVNGRFAITCDYEKGLQKAGEGDGVAQLSEDHQADKDFVVNCPILLPDGTPNTSDALSSVIPNPAGLFSYQQVKLSALTPRFSPASASAAAPVACPQCTGQTLIRVVLVADLTGTFPWYYSLSTWTQRAGAGPDSGAMWDTFRTNLAAHEAGHLAIFRSDYVAPVTAASNVFVKTACIGEVCFDPNASNGQTQAYNKARNLANAQLALVRATWNAALSAAWSTHGTKQAAYDTTTQHGGTQSVVGGADVFTVLGLNLNE